jgi:hypothetical protein
MFRFRIGTLTVTEQSDYVIDFNNAYQFLILVHDGKGQKIIFVEDFGYSILLLAGFHEEKWIGGEFH